MPTFWWPPDHRVQLERHVQHFELWAWRELAPYFLWFVGCSLYRLDDPKSTVSHLLVVGANFCLPCPWQSWSSRLVWSLQSKYSSRRRSILHIHGDLFISSISVCRDAMFVTYQVRTPNALSDHCLGPHSRIGPVETFWLGILLRVKSYSPCVRSKYCAFREMVVFVFIILGQGCRCINFGNVWQSENLFDNCSNVI